MNEQVIKEIKAIVKKIRSDYKIGDNTVIGEDIFKILRTKGHILFFPLMDEPDLDGFHIKRTVNDVEQAYIYINTSKKVEKNIFCAAHELGHVYEVDNVIYGLDDRYKNEDSEEIMNRFAAELLMPESIFTEQCIGSLNKYKNDNKISVADILRTIVFLMDYFFVPYKAVVRRMNEIGVINDLSVTNLEKLDGEIVEQFIYEGHYTKLIRKNNLKDFDGLQEEIIYAEDNCIYGLKKINEIREDFEIPITDEAKMQHIGREFIDMPLNQD